jgi:hypothetical protein
VLVNTGIFGDATGTAPDQLVTAGTSEMSVSIIVLEPESAESPVRHLTLLARAVSVAGRLWLVLNENSG